MKINKTKEKVYSVSISWDEDGNEQYPQVIFPLLLPLSLGF